MVACSLRIDCMQHLDRAVVETIQEQGRCHVCAREIWVLGRQEGARGVTYGSPS